MRKVIYLLLVVTVVLIGASCSKFRRIEKSQDWRVKYEAGLDYYARKKYYKASILFDQILPIVRGLPEGEKVQFYQAYCQYYEELYLLASEQFRTFYETYGRSTMAEEARFMYAYSLYQQSPNPNLDQTSSIEGMASLQEFLNRYPNSKFKDQAIESIFDVQGKLEIKGFENAKQYYRMRQYKAAIVSLDNFSMNFPDSKYVEEAQFLVIVSHYKLASQSIRSKQDERYKSAIEDYREFIDRYPQSPYLRDAERYYTESLTKITK